MNIFRKICILVSGFAVVVNMNFGALSAFAANESQFGLGVSPMKEKIILEPGETFNGSFSVTNPAKNSGTINYVAVLSPFYATDDYDVTYENTGDYNRIVDWITLKNTSGTLSPNEVNNIDFVINVPNDAPAGGQYAAIIVKTADSESSLKESSDTGVQINQSMGIAHTIFAEVTGTTKHSGKIVSADLPSFLLDGKIKGSATIENTGNVHSDAIYTMQVFPLFSSEEIYTNEEDPDTAIILPERTRYHETVWNETPTVGIFNVKYIVDFEGMTTEISKLVIVCPLWLLFIIIFAVVALIIWIIIVIKKNKAKKAEN